MKKSPPISPKPERTPRFQDNLRLNALLEELKVMLRPLQDMLSVPESATPVACIVGTPRSGTTLLLQWMASIGSFSYPSNLLARFSYAPYIGARIQQMLFDPAFDYHGDFRDLHSAINFDSELGKSCGALACNEFQHFFRNYMPNTDFKWLDDDSVALVDCDGMSQGLASIEYAFGKPFVTKASLLQFNISYFAENIPRLFWFHIKRDPVFSMQSLLAAREKYYGSREIWWSAKPKEYDALKPMDVFHQIAGQVYFTRCAVESGMRKVPASHRMTIEYESFCQNPKSVYEKMVEKYAALGCELPPVYSAAKSFRCGNDVNRLDTNEDTLLLKAAYDDFASGSVRLGRNP